jgi:hypothetical protein
MRCRQPIEACAPEWAGDATAAIAGGRGYFDGDRTKSSLGWAASSPRSRPGPVISTSRSTAPLRSRSTVPRPPGPRLRMYSHDGPRSLLLADHPGGDQRGDPANTEHTGTCNCGEGVRIHLDDVEQLGSFIESSRLSRPRTQISSVGISSWRPCELRRRWRAAGRGAGPARPAGVRAGLPLALTSASSSTTSKVAEVPQAARERVSTVNVGLT